MGLTRVENDPRASKACTAAATESVGYAEAATKHFFDLHGHVATIGRGTLDTSITYVSLRNTSGTEVFCYPNAAGNGLIVTPVAP